MALVQKIADSRNLNRQISNGWWDKFCARNPSITLRASVSLSQARANATDPEVIDSYFDLLQTTMTERDLLDKPCQIFNIDESGFSLAPKSPKGIHVVGDHSAKDIKSGDKSQITVLACVSAGGHVFHLWLSGIGSLSALSSLMVRFLEQYMVCQTMDGWIMNFSMFGFTIIF